MSFQEREPPPSNIDFQTSPGGTWYIDIRGVSPIFGVRLLPKMVYIWFLKIYSSANMIFLAIKFGKSNLIFKFYDNFVDI